MKEQYWKYSLIILIVVVGFVLFRQAQPFMNGVLAAVTLYILLRNFSQWLHVVGCMAADNRDNVIYLDASVFVRLGCIQPIVGDASQYAEYYPAGAADY